MGKGIHGSMRPPPHAIHKPYITSYLAAGGWQSQCVFWAGEHWDVWDTGGGPYGYEAEARADATEWANAWGYELRLPDGPPSPDPAPSLVDFVQPILMLSSPEQRVDESESDYLDRLRQWVGDGA